jgi:uncharacterized DUF497 family protein
VSTEFEWDDEKAAANFSKHGVRFETAARVFLDPLVYIEQDRMVENEARWQAIGMVDRQQVLLVAHVVRERGGVEVIRIISARKAERSERRRYEEANG